MWYGVISFPIVLVENCLRVATERNVFNQLCSSTVVQIIDIVVNFYVQEVKTRFHGASLTKK